MSPRADVGSALRSAEGSSREAEPVLADTFVLWKFTVVRVRSDVVRQEFTPVALSTEMGSAEWMSCTVLNCQCSDVIE